MHLSGTSFQSLVRVRVYPSPLLLRTPTRFALAPALALLLLRPVLHFQLLDSAVIAHTRPVRVLHPLKMSTRVFLRVADLSRHTLGSASRRPCRVTST